MPLIITNRIIMYAFLVNQVMKYFHAFILLLMANCLAAVHVMALQQPSASSLWLVRCCLYSHVVVSYGN